MEAAQANCYVAGNTAPGDGICVRMAEGSVYGAPIRTRNTSDIVIRHLRVRHGYPSTSDPSASDSFAILTGCSNIVIDHCSFTWGNDEAYSIFGDNTHDVTISHCIAGEGVVYTSGGGGHNLGPLYSGNPNYNICTHHCLFIHFAYRSPRYQMSGTGFNGSIQANNVHYNLHTQMTSVAMNFYMSTVNAQYVDVINDYFKAGPDSPSNLYPFILNKDTTGTYPDVSICFEGSTYRNVDGTAHANNNEANNYELNTMMKIQLSPAANYEPINYVTRTTRLDQPENAITITSAEQAYTDVVIDGDVGATKPAHDSVDARLVAAPENGDAWSNSNVPAPVGTASYPTLSTYNVPTDTSGNGLPDSYQEGFLGIDKNSAYNPAATDTNGDGYSDIENWIESL
jgi:hypothetical protein